MILCTISAAFERHIARLLNLCAEFGTYFLGRFASERISKNRDAFGHLENDAFFAEKVVRATFLRLCVNCFINFNITLKSLLIYIFFRIVKNHESSRYKFY